MHGAKPGGQRKWIGEVLEGSSDVPLPGGRFEVKIVGDDICVGDVALTPDTLSKNPRVRLRAP